MVRLLVKRGVDPRRLSAVSLGEFAPRASNDTAKGRSRNRRIEITLLKDQVKGLNTNITQREEAMAALIKEKDLWAKDLKEACEVYTSIDENDPDPVGTLLDRLKEKEDAN